MKKSINQVGLVLTGGGARAAYQAGVLKGISEILDQEHNPFPVVTGVSAGAINAAFLAAQKGTFQESAQNLWSLWENITFDQIVKTNAFTFLKLGMKWVKDLSAGKVEASAGSGSGFLFDTSPLREFLEKNIDIAQISENLKSGKLNGIALSATNYKTGTAISFYETNSKLVKPWARTNRIGQQKTIGIDHVMASSAIPIFFPPVQSDGTFYGDGCIRLSAPLSPAIHLGASKVLAIGIRRYRDPEDTVKLNEASLMDSVSLIDIAGILLNAVFLDSLESDLERMKRINRTLEKFPKELRDAHPDQLRPIPILDIKPSGDLGQLAKGEFERLPVALKHMMKGIGASSEKGLDLMSYLSFDGNYTKKLLQMGYEDAMISKKEIVTFFESES